MPSQRQDDKESRLVRLTGLWRGETSAGETYLSGRVNQTSRLVILPAKAREDGSKGPDYVAYLAASEEKACQPRPERRKVSL